MALETLDNATLEVCEGEYLDISFQERAAVGVEDILNVARKHGALFGASARLGGIAAGAESEILDALTAFGTAAGTARSLNTDLKALWPDPDSERDDVQRGRLQSKKKSLATAHAIETGTPAIRRRLGEIFMKRVLDPADFDVITSILEETGSRSFSENRVETLTEEAISALKSGGFPGQHRATLADAVRLIVGSA
jgi:geranylgeranyl pyrophosphate synthase